MSSGQIQVIFFDLGETLVTGAAMWLPGAKALLNSLHQHSLRLGIISNTSNLADRQAILSLLPDDFPIDRFEAGLVLFSSEVGIAKPDRQIFAKAVGLANVPAGECLYCSENVVESLVAQQVGMRAIRVQTTPNSDLATIETDLAKYHSQI